MRHGTHMDESWHYAFEIERVFALARVPAYVMSHGTHMNESRHTYE